MSSGEITSGRFILTLPLKTELYQEHILEKRFRLGEQLYNKFLNFEKKKYFEMTKRKDYRYAQNLIKDLTYQIKSLNNASDNSKETKKTIQDLKKQRKNQYDVIYNIKKKFNWSEFGFGMDMKKYRGYYKKNLNSHICNNLAVRCFRAFEKMEEELIKDQYRSEEDINEMLDCTLRVPVLRFQQKIVLKHILWKPKIMRIEKQNCCRRWMYPDVQQIQITTMKMEQVRKETKSKDGIFQKRIRNIVMSYMNVSVRNVKKRN